MVEHKTKQHFTEYLTNILITKKLLTYVQLIEVHMQEQRDNIYVQGNNGIGQLGDTTTTDKYRPTKMQGWDPVANNGIAVWAINGNGDDGWVKY